MIYKNISWTANIIIQLKGIMAEYYPPISSMHHVQQSPNIPSFHEASKKCPAHSNVFPYKFHEWRGSVCYCLHCCLERSRNGNKIYAPNNKLMIFRCIPNNNLPREALKFNKLLYFAWAFYGKIRKWKQKRIIHISNRIKFFPFSLRMCCAKHNNLSSGISFFDWARIFQQHEPSVKVRIAFDASMDES